LEIRCWRFGTGDFTLFCRLITSLLKAHAVKPITSLNNKNEFLLIISIFLQRSRKYSLFEMQTRHCYETLSFTKTSAVIYSFTYGPGRIPTHKFFISSPIYMIFSSEDTHITTASNCYFDGKPCSEAVN
jgi:hypothetical protein